MRVPGQKRRIDLYIMQGEFQPLLEMLHTHIGQMGIPQKQCIPWRYGMPTARRMRQEVPGVRKLAEVGDVLASVPFNDVNYSLNNGVLCVDSEVPGRDQTAWKNEGGSRQIHFGVFKCVWRKAPPNKSSSVKIYIPSSYVLHRFVEPIQENWVN